MFSLVNAIAIFFNLGIGVDHIFVFTDAWNQNRHESLRVQVVTTYQRAGTACAVTTFATSMAFAANIISPIPALRSFGIFMSICIVAGFLQALLFWPVVLFVTDCRRR